ncbi:MAG: hypothetical protein AB1410_09415 [Acidobacteriota bacterium]
MLKNLYLILEIEENKVKMMEVLLSGKKIKINKYHQFEVDNFERMPFEIGNKIQEERYKAKEAVLLLPSSLINQFSITVPPLSPKDLSLIIAREVKKLVPSLEDVQFDYFLSGEGLLEGGVRKKEAIVSMVLKEHLNKYIDILNKINLIPSKMTSSSQAFFNVLKLTKGVSKGTSISFLDVSENKASLLIFKENIWVLTREFPIKSEILTESEMEISRLLQEITRSFQFFKQKNRGYEVNSMLIGGTFEYMDKLIDPIRTGLKIPISFVNWEMVKDFVEIPPISEKDLRAFLSNFYTLIGGALSVILKEGINFVPKEISEKIEIKRRIKQTGIAAAIFILVFIGVNSYLGSIGSKYKKEIKQKEKSYQEASSYLEEINKIKEIRLKFYERREILKSPKEKSYIISKFIQDLSLIIPAEINIKSFSTTNKISKWEVDFKGEVNSKDQTTAQDSFIKFFQKIREFSYSKNFSFSGLNLKGDRNPPTMQGPETKSNIILEFSVKGELYLGNEY